MEGGRFRVSRFWRRGSFPGTLVALGLGVGANSATVMLAASLLATAPDYVRNPERVVLVPAVSTYQEYRNVRARARTLDVAAFTRVDLSLGLGPAAETVNVECATRGYFDIFPVRPVLGRGFGGSEEVRGATPLVLGHGLWVRQFGKDPAVLGRTVMLGNRGHVVVGVAPPGFKGIEQAETDVWLSLEASADLCSFTGTDLRETVGGAWLRTAGRVRDGFTISAAAAEISSLTAGARLDGTGSDAAGPGRRVVVAAYGSWRSRMLDGQVALWLVGAAGLMLVAACLNVGVLLSIQAFDRVREFVVRAQLGATRMRVFLEFMLEHLAATGVCGLAAAGVGVGVGRLLVGWLPLAGMEAFAGGEFFLLVGTLALLACVASGIGPALWVSRVAATAGRPGGALSAPSGEGLRSVFVTAQFALAVVLVVGTGLFVGTVRHLGRTPGLDADRVVVATVDLVRVGYGAQRIRAVFETFRQRVERLPQVASSTVSLAPLMGSGGVTRAFPMRTARGVAPASVPMFNAVSPGYFRTVGTRILRGRGFEDGDAGGGPVAVVNVGLAEQLWGASDAIGRCVVVGGVPCVEVVGVNEDRRHVSVTGVHGELFVPLSQAALYIGDDVAPRTLLVRARGSGRAAVGAVAAELRGFDEDLPFVDVRLLADLVDDQTRSWRLGATVFGLLGSLALLLGAVGSFAALNLSVRTRTREFGIRMALGAGRRDVVGAVVRRGMGIVFAGLVIGVVASAATYRLMDSLLVGLTAADPVSFGIASVVVFGAGVAATVEPAVRAARLDPARECTDV